MNSNKHSIEWTNEHIDILCTMWAAGEPSRKIAERLGRTRNSVIGRAHRLTLASRAGERPGRPAKPNAHRRAPPRLPMAPRVVQAAKLRRWIEEIPPSEARMISLMELKAGDCKWPIGDPAKPGFGFCGVKSFGSFPYCGHHVAMAYTPVKARGQAPKLPPLHSGVNGSWRQAQVPA